VAEHIRELIRQSRVCIADLSESNPNVMYEIALAHSESRPVVLITQGEPEAIPFDVRHLRVIRYTPGKKKALLEAIKQALRAAMEYEISPAARLRQMLVPKSIRGADYPFVVAASPLSYREAFRTRGGWKERPLGTYADHLGIRGLMQSFGLIFGLNRLPEFLNPDDFHDDVLSKPAHLFAVASPKTNRWTRLVLERFFENRTPRWEFQADPDSKDLRNPKVQLCVDGRPYEPVHQVEGGRLVWDFGVVLRGPSPFGPACMFMVLAGRSSRGTEATSLAATDPQCLEKLLKRLEEERIDVEDHRQAFCAVVSVAADRKNVNLGPDKDSFRVEDLAVYR